MRITPLASGSAGNATLVETDGVSLLIDAGLRIDELVARLEATGRRPRDVDALLLTHRHRDHVRGATEFASTYRARVHAVRRTMRAVGSQTGQKLRKIFGDEEVPFAVGDLRIWPIAVRHDAPQTRAFLLETPTCRYGHVTDLGCLEGRVGEYLTACDGLYLEFNHDRDLLLAGPYSPNLKARVLSDEGHLNNEQSRELLARLRHPRLRHVWLAHLSKQNNRPELALAAARAALGDDVERVTLRIAAQDEPGETVDLAMRPTGTPSAAPGEAALA
jgi:phosphoribosyl 1,2-cyclic phosphodiesterase